MNFKQGLFKNILVSGGYTYLSQIINFLSSIILARLLSPSSYGTVGLMTVFTGFMMVFADGGLSFALIRSDYGKTYQKVLANIAWIFGLVLFGVVIIISYPISKFYNNQDLFLPTIVLGLTFIIKSLGLVQGAILAKELKFAVIGKINLISMVLTVSVTIITALLGFGFWALIISQIVNAIATTILYERNVKLGFKIYPQRYILSVFKMTKRLVSSIIGYNSINYWARNADNLIAGKWFGPANLGIYNRAYSLLTLPLMLITGLFNNILFPSLKKLKDQGGDLEKEYYLVLRIIPFLSYPLVFLFIIFPSQLVELLWGKDWLSVASLLPYFGLLVFTQTIHSTGGQLLILQNKEREYMFSGWVNSIVIVGAIIYGATVSLVAIAAYYSLAFIIFVLTFNLFYVFIHVLKFDYLRACLFWIPKILISTFLWFAIKFNLDGFKLILLFFTIIYIFFIGRQEIFGILRKINVFRKHPSHV